MVFLCTFILIFPHSPSVLPYVFKAFCLFLMVIFIYSLIHGLSSELVFLLFKGIQTSRAVCIVELKISTLVSIFTDRCPACPRQAPCQDFLSFLFCLPVSQLSNAYPYFPLTKSISQETDLIILNVLMRWSSVFYCSAFSFAHRGW